MFNRKTKIKIEFTNTADGYDVSHNISSKTNKVILAALITDLVNGKLGYAILANMTLNPEICEYSNELKAILNPPQTIETGPVIKASQAISNFVHQVKNLLN